MIQVSVFHILTSVNLLLPTLYVHALRSTILDTMYSDIVGRVSKP